MNFNGLKIILKIPKYNYERSQPDIHIRESTCGLVHIFKTEEKFMQ